MAYTHRRNGSARFLRHSKISRRTFTSTQRTSRTTTMAPSTFDTGTIAIDREATRAGRRGQSPCERDRKARQESSRERCSSCRGSGSRQAGSQQWKGRTQLGGSPNTTINQHHPKYRSIRSPRAIGIQSQAQDDHRVRRIAVHYQSGRNSLQILEWHPSQFIEHSLRAIVFDKQDFMLIDTFL